MNTMIAVGRGVKTPLFYAHNIEQDGRYKYNYKRFLQRKNLSIYEWINLQ